MWIPSSWRERLFLNLAIFTLMAAIAALTGIAVWLARIGVPDPVIRALLMVGAVGLLYVVAPAIATKFHKWGDSTLSQPSRSSRTSDERRNG